VRRNGNDGRNSINSEAPKANGSYLPAFDLAIFGAMQNCLTSILSSERFGHSSAIV
jgi:hypothetical protein